MKVRQGGSEEIPLVQGKEQRLHFVGAALKRYPTPKVRETQVPSRLWREQRARGARRTESASQPGGEGGWLPGRRASSEAFL